MSKVAYMRQGGGVETEAGKDMESKNPYAKMKNPKEGMDYLRQEIDKRKQILTEGKDVPQMACGGMMAPAGMEVIIGVEEESGNEIPAGSTAKEVADDVPAMLSEGEYVIPADVVRWHGVKALEMMRQEAKMGLGMMAEDGRVSNHEASESEEYEESEESEEGYYPKEEVEVVEAARGTFLGGIMDTIYGRSAEDDESEDVAEEVTKEDVATDTEENAAPTTFYRWSVMLDPITGRYKYVPVLQETVEREVTNEDGTTEIVKETVAKVVSPEEFNPDQATRYTVDEQLKEIYQEFGEDDELSDAADIEAAGCPNGFVFDAAIGACMATTSGDGQLDMDITGPVQYADQMSTKIAYSMGAYTADDLKDYSFEGSDLSDAAISRMTEPSDVSLLGSAATGFLTGGPLGAITGLISGTFRKGIDAIGAKRAALTRADELGNMLSGSGTDPETGLLSAPQAAYNWTYNTETASFVPTSPSSVITSVGRSDAAKSADNKLGLTVGSYEDVVNGKVVDWNSTSDIDDLMESIDNQLSMMNTVTGKGSLATDKDTYDRMSKATEDAQKQGAAIRKAEEERIEAEARAKAEAEAKAAAAAEKARQEAAAAAAEKARAEKAANEAAAARARAAASDGYGSSSNNYSTSSGSAYDSSNTGGYSTGSVGTSSYGGNTAGGYTSGYGGWAKGGLMSSEDKDKKESK
jgi:hypothetical protein